MNTESMHALKSTSRDNETNTHTSTTLTSLDLLNDMATTLATTHQSSRNMTRPSTIAAPHDLSTHHHLLRSHGNVMDFVEKPTAYDTPRMTEELRPIEDLPSDISEGVFARVKFLGKEYWITRDREDDDVLVQGEKGYVVVVKEVDVVTVVSGD
ncbi:MAG: hypothetical protein L6R38_000985 [Xanthoria sp. 2 TBL-2021]|nr:MAG: hypothetical protein L6R38_000985 [Xanthoria sp. 2 TBL-2021]